MSQPFLPNVPAVSSVPSPCTNVCKMHEATGWCQGCARTIPEITIWSKADDATRRSILAQLPTRREVLLDQGVFTAATAADISGP
ncbi:DUF1289 domain-containing protein [Roseateles koreensis]|uniref:DUF1289 domain-containing protein n=1 Tax=Roseateles koreensis TaxID=2987526 RepID=A0ABT5KN92_9BURK|nr:DUF1289 domain-containing protein [Roseateles koreensis]MDC8783925.1 DUF1289 domain-containing protein [Roseateles koreensis]